MDEFLFWWGYIHKETGFCIVKRYMNLRDLEEVKESSFVGQIYGPFEAASKSDAVDIIFKMVAE